MAASSAPSVFPALVMEEIPSDVFELCLCAMSEIFLDSQKPPTLEDSETDVLFNEPCWKSLGKRVGIPVEKSASVLFAAHYLGIPQLEMWAASCVAENLHLVDNPREIPSDIALRILETASWRILHSTSLNTLSNFCNEDSELWKTLCCRYFKIASLGFLTYKDSGTSTSGHHTTYLVMLLCAGKKHSFKHYCKTYVMNVDA